VPVRVLLVCSGNTCRSAMGEGILRQMAAWTPDVGIEVASAGTLRIVGAPATREAIQVAAEHGVDISGHQSSPVTEENVRAASVVLAMTELHVDELQAEFPEAAGRIHLLSVFADGSDRDVPDPVGGPVEEYESVYAMLEELLEHALPRLAAVKDDGAGS